ncbi:MAG: hypothetical protein N2053_05365, partial [Chitinispirillaceae bacterium]|nr:hypothetical protein [Chitinispirillaceae bacterium]
SGVCFDITGIGIFCLDSMEVYFDDFIAAEGTEFGCNTLIVRRENLYKRDNISFPLLDKRELPIFDFLGRQIRKNGNNRFLSLRNGIYVTSEAKILNISKIKTNK